MRRPPVRNRRGRHRRGRGLLALGRTVLIAGSLVALAAPSAVAEAPIAETAVTEAPGASVPRPKSLGPEGTATVHGDVFSTDTLPGRGPGLTPKVSGAPTGSTCSTVFVGSDGMPVALCTAYLGLNPPQPLAPTVVLFEPDSGVPLTSVQLTKGALLGGVYGYLDNADRVVVADGAGRLLAVAHERDPQANWRMRVDVLADLSSAIPSGDAITGLSPGFEGQIWFATSGGAVGTVRPGVDGSARTLALPSGERITNGLTVRPGGASVITTRALYELDFGSSEGLLSVRWRRDYAVGQARKPGLLAHGSGTTPTYFSVDDGPDPAALVAITDDSDNPELLVLRRVDGSLVCRLPAFATSVNPGSAAPDGALIPGPAATENSLIVTRDGSGTGLVLVNTYGFQYPPFAVDGPSQPADAPYFGGMTRVDVSDDGGCQRRWTNGGRTASLPKLTREDGLIHTLAYGPSESNPAQKIGPVFYTATEAATGREVDRTLVGFAPIDEPMELTSTIAAPRGGGPGVLWQPTLGRMLRISTP